MSIQNWPEQQRPREKLLALGSHSLTDSELLALLLRTGCKGMNVIELSDYLLQHFNGLNNLLSTDHRKLSAIKGLGQAKTTQLAAILELCRRVLKQKLQDADIINSPQATREYLQIHFQGLSRERFGCLLLDTRHRVISLEILFEGTLDSAAVYPREVVKQALTLNSASVILCHNHPSGNPEPSQADIRMTKILTEALALVDVKVLDHMIIGHGEIFSMAEHGMLSV